MIFRLRRPRSEIWALFQPQKMIFFLWLFLIVFPKGGFKIGSIPITWGYLFIGLGGLCASLRKSWSIRPPRFNALLCLLPFQFVTSLTMIYNGIDSVQWTVSFFVCFFLTPCAFLFLFSHDIETMDLSLFFTLLKKGVAFVSYYGIFLFIYKQATGKYLEIPFLTVNWGDLGTLDDFKCNSRGVVSKLISTYNNGQLFGISILILFPLYCYVQKNRWHRLATKAAIVLTLSRTAWLGLLFHDFFYNLFIEKSKKRGIINLVITFCFFLVGLIGLSYVYKFGAGFFFDGNFGGRRRQFEELGNYHFFSSKPFGGFEEMAYVAIVSTFGVIGLITYLIAMVGPIFLYPLKAISPIRRAIVLGIGNYLFVSISDGATLYIPVLAFFWFSVSLLGRKNLGTDETLICTIR